MSKAYTVTLGQSSSNPADNDPFVHQTSPTWVLTFVRWNVRDPLRTPDSDPLEVRDYLIVENDCVQLSVTDSKSNLTPSFNAILKETDINYATELKPGDFCFINMVNSEDAARNIVNKVVNSKPINEYGDGFKGFFKIQGVRRQTVSETAGGKKTNFYRINGFAFTEFNNTIYFDQNLVNQPDLQSQGLFISKIAQTWSQLTTKLAIPPLQDLISFLIKAFIGVGINEDATQVSGLLASPNVHFKVPILVGRLLGVTHSFLDKKQDVLSVQAAKDLYHYIFGIQHYNASAQTAAAGLNPDNLKNTDKISGFYYTAVPCEGKSVLKPEFWNQVKLWSILNQYTNSPLNEMFTSFRVSPNGRVMPTVVFRQIPFTTEEFDLRKLGNYTDSQSLNITTTKFLNIPRWSITSDMIFDADLGTDEAARINFVQFYARSALSPTGYEIAQETARKNYVYDAKDVQRSGLRPYVIQNTFDDIPNDIAYKSPIWARIIGDAVIGGHLKLNGSMLCIGIMEPIPVGDNVQFNGNVYHIEQVTHTCSIDPGNGNKIFRTSLALSNGISANSSTSGTRYAEMTNTTAQADLQHDYKNQQILPGISESQDIRSPNRDVDADTAIQNPFVQPNLNSSKKGT